MVTTRGNRLLSDVSSFLWRFNKHDGGFIERYIYHPSLQRDIGEDLAQTLAIKSRPNLLPLKFHRLACCRGAVYLGISVSSSAGPGRGELLVNWSQGNKINFYISPSLTKFYSIDYTGSNKQFVSLTSRYKVKLLQNKI